MSDKSFKEVIAEIKLAYTISDYIEQSGIQLKRRGNKAQGLCPFHNEKTPSFSVDDSTQSYKCFGCGQYGDILSFVQNYENLTFYDSLKKLAEDKNIEFNIQGKNESGVDYQSLRACIKDAANFYHKEFRKLDNQHPAKQQILSRGLSLTGILYGYAPEGYDTLYKFLSSQGYSDETILAVGVARKSEKSGRFFDFWQGRLMFYITDAAGKVIGFSARKLYENDKMGKYVNSSDSYLFDKSSSLFNIAVAKKKAVTDKLIYVVEGQFDVAAFVETGLVNAVATSGTAFTEKQGNIIRRLVTEEGKIVFCFDGDSAGVEAAIKVFNNVPILHSQAYIVSFPEDTDPSDYRFKHGNEKLVDFVENNAVPMIEFVLKHLSKKFDMESSMDRSNFIGMGAKALNTLSSRALRETYIAKLALDSYSSVAVIKEALEKAHKESKTSNSLDSNFVENFVNGFGKKSSSSRHGNTEFDSEFDDSDEFDTNDAYDPNENGYEDGIDAERIIEKIENSDDYVVYGIIARMLLLSAMDRSLATEFVKFKKFAPEDIKWVFDDTESSAKHERLIPELFSSTDVVKHIFTSKNIFPLSHLLSGSLIHDQFEYLGKKLANIVITSKEDMIKRKYAKILQDSKSNDISILNKILEEEKKQISKLEVAYSMSGESNNE